jgi:hypothetical protein
MGPHGDLRGPRRCPYIDLGSRLLPGMHVQLGTPIALFRWGQREVARCNGSPPSVRRAASCSNQAATCHDPPAAVFSRNSRDFLGFFWNFSGPRNATGTDDFELAFGFEELEPTDNYANSLPAIRRG